MSPCSMTGVRREKKGKQSNLETEKYKWSRISCVHTLHKSFHIEVFCTGKRGADRVVSVRLITVVIWLPSLPLTDS